jgi:hypothetical protein
MEPLLPQRQKLDDNYIPFMPNEAPTAETGHSFDTRLGMRDDIPIAEPLESLIPELRRLASKSQVAPRAPSIVRRTLRAIGRFCLAILIGVGITLGWQSYGEQAKELVVHRMPSLAVFFAMRTEAASSKNTVPALSVARTELASSLSVAALNAVVQNLTEIQKTLEQLAAKQEVMASSITTLQEAENEIGHRLSSSQATAPLPPKKKAPVAAAAHVSQVQPSPSPAGAPAPRAPLSLRAD